MHVRRGLLRLLVIVVAAGCAIVAQAWAVSAAMLAVPDDLDTVINNLVKMIAGLAAGLATLFLTIGAVLLLVAGGDPEQVSRAKGALKNAAIGYVVAVVAPLIVTLLKKAVGEQ